MHITSSLEARANDGILKAGIMPFLCYNILTVDDVWTFETPSHR